MSEELIKSTYRIQILEAINILFTKENIKAIENKTDTNFMKGYNKALKDIEKAIREIK